MSREILTAHGTTRGGPVSSDRQQAAVRYLKQHGEAGAPVESIISFLRGWDAAREAAGLPVSPEMPLDEILSLSSAAHGVDF